jgi:integrase/recombinase XerD
MGRPNASAAPRLLPKILNAEQLEGLLARPNITCPTGLRNRAILELLVGAGLRASEVCGVYLRDIDWKRSELRIRSEVGKGGREALLPLDDRTFSWLERWKPERRHHAAGAPWLFVTLKGGQLDRRYIWEMVSRYARKAGIEEPIWPHRLRHTFGTELLRDGFDLREVQSLMRHADIRTTVIYTYVAPEQLAAKVRRRRR